ncbi:hypothetical protein [Microvirga massiliensis]|uniref:hypothetical protein n=1 Tax=Microvirga massiliensis TaxID=1033741 RepID=UPI00062B8456|nr:hypothetical protein [Microvirga massiliensis]
MPLEYFERGVLTGFLNEVQDLMLGEPECGECGDGILDRRMFVLLQERSPGGMELLLKRC